MEERQKDPPQPLDEEKQTYVHVNCSYAEKGAWVRESRRRGIKLGQLVREVMNSTINDEKQ